MTTSSVERPTAFPLHVSTPSRLCLFETRLKKTGGILPQDFTLPSSTARRRTVGGLQSLR